MPKMQSSPDEVFLRRIIIKWRTVLYKVQIIYAIVYIILYSKGYHTDIDKQCIETNVTCLKKWCISDSKMSFDAISSGFTSCKDSSTLELS